MSYWARIKAAAIGSDLLTKNPQLQTQPQVKPPFGAQLPAPSVVKPTVAPTQPTAPAPTPIVEQPLGNQFVTRQKGLRKTPAQLQTPIDGQLRVMMNDLNKNPQFESLRKRYERENKNFLSAIGDFFSMTDQHMAMGRVWYRLLIMTNPKHFPNAQAVKKILEVDPESIAAEVKKIIDQNPAFVYDLANQYAYKADPQQAGGIPSLNDKKPGKGGDGLERGDMGGMANYNSAGELVEQEQQNNLVLPERHEMADFWSRQKKNTIVAPEMTADEAEEIQTCLEQLEIVGPQAIADIRDHLIFKVLGPDGKPLSDSMDPAFRERAIQDGFKWAFQGISENEKLDGDVAMTNWQEYAKLFHGLDPKTTDMGDIMGTISQDLLQVSKLPDEQKQEAPIMEFIRTKAGDYMTNVYDISRTNKLFDINDFRPKQNDLKSFRRMAKITYACAQREYRFLKAQELAGADEEDKKQDKAGTALRRGAFVKSKINTIIDHIDKILDKPVGTFIPFGDAELSGKKKYLHMDHTGHLAIRTIEFPREFQIASEKHLQAYISNSSKGNDEPLTLFNFSDISGMIPNTSFVPSVLDEVGGIDPAGRKKKQITNKEVSPLSKTLSDGNQTDPTVAAKPRGLEEYRKALAAHVKTFVDKAGGIEAVVQELNALPTDMGERASNPNINTQWLGHIISGTPTNYAASDFAALAEAVGVPADELYAPYAHEYDKHNINDLNMINAEMSTAPALFLRYFTHRKRIQKQRGFNAQNWSNKAMASFFHMCRPHTHYSNFLKPDIETQNQGKPFFDAIDQEAPVGNSIPSIDPETGKIVREPITGPEQAMRLQDGMNTVTPGDIYFKNDNKNPEQLSRKPHLRPSSPVDEMLRPDGKGGFSNSTREVDWSQMWQSVTDSFKAAHPEAAGMGTVELLGLMKQEKEQDHSRRLENAQNDIEHYTSLLNDPVDSQQETLADIGEKDAKITHFVKKQEEAGVTEEQYKSQVIELATRRLNELSQKNNMDAQQYSLHHIKEKIESAKRTVEQTNLTLNALKNINPGVLAEPAKTPEGKRVTGPEKKQHEKQMYKKIIDLLVPNKYKTHRYESSEQVGKSTKFKPLDFVTDFDEVPAATAAALNLFIKTSSSFDKLYDIKARLRRLAMPTAIVDDLIDRLDDEYERQMVVIMRRLDGRRNASNAPTAARQERRRMWSLL